MLIKKIEDVLKEHFKTGPIQFTGTGYMLMRYVDGTVQVHIAKDDIEAMTMHHGREEGMPNWSYPEPLMVDKKVCVNFKMEDGFREDYVDWERQEKLEEVVSQIGNIARSVEVDE